MKEDDLDRGSCPTHDVTCQWSPQPFHHTYAWTPGRETGVYKLDYGKYATHDLTVKGKFERLRRDGAVSDPFQDFKEGQRKGEIPKYDSGITEI